MRGRKAQLQHTKLIIGYVRVSTADQADSGVSLDAQSARIRAYAALQGVAIDELVVDAGASAATLQRPGFHRVLTMVRSGAVSTLIVCKLDRATRSVRDLSDLLDLFAQNKVSFISLSESLDTATAAGRMMLHLLGVFAEFERSMIAERTASALAHKRAMGKAYGRTPFGYQRVNDRLESQPDQQLALQMMRDMHSAGCSLREIAKALQDRGIAGPRGGGWHASGVRAVLRSRMTQESKTQTALA